MSEFLKPDNLNIVWASGGDRLYPGDTKYQSGWGVEIPPRQYFNEIDYKQDQMLAHLNQHGIPVWDIDTEYQANKSYVQGSTGTIFQCVLTHTGQDPELDTADTYWRIAFAAAGDFYTKTEADAAFITPSELSAYSYGKTETYNKTEVDGRTTVASTLQSQQQTSNSVLLTPLRLSEAFKGVNQSLLASSGKQRLPGGLILQWANISASNSGPATFTYSEPISVFLFGGVQINATSTTASTSITTSILSATSAYSFITTSATVQNHFCFVVGVL